MSQPRNAQSFWRQRSLLKQLSCLSGVGILSSGVALAQAPSDIPQIVISTPSKAAPSVSQTASDLMAPSAVSPASAKPEPPALQIETVPQSTTSPSTASPANEYEAPSTIVFTDRSSGCEFALEAGKTLANGACGSPTKVARERSSGFTGGYSTAQAAAPIRVERVSYERRLENTAPPVTTPLSASAFVKNYYNRSVRPLGIPGNNNVRLLFPLSIPSVITSVFGWRVHPITGDQRHHSGTDLGVPMGTPVLAALTGRVMLADFFGGYGLAIALEHTQGTQQTLYAHLSEIFVKPGEVVKQGTVIGRVGSTGNSTGPHLHFEFRQLTTQGWVAQDPGVQLESALAQLVQSLQTAQKLPVPPKLSRNGNS
ncbi:peptidoglycan DD-metalloendopeptidase family protein [Phormidesmis sp. 146-35]